MYSTSRYASNAARSVAITLSKKNSSFYISRGKKTISQICDFGRKRGERELFLIYDSKTSFTIKKILINPLGEWNWDSTFNQKL